MVRVLLSVGANAFIQSRDNGVLCTVPMKTVTCDYHSILFDSIRFTVDSLVESYQKKFLSQKSLDPCVILWRHIKLVSLLHTVLPVLFIKRHGRMFSPC